MRKSTLFSILFFITSVFIDQFSKKLALGSTTLRYNQGFIMGYYADLPDSVRIIALASFAGFLFTLYLCLLLIIPTRARILQYALSLIIGGIFGNVIDKTVLGMTIDFIHFSFFGIHTFFNFADLSLWIGALMILWILFRRDKLLWYPGNSRQSFLVRPKEQFRTALVLGLVAFSSCLVLGVFSYTFFDTILKPLNPGRQNIMLTYFLTYITLSLLFCLLTFVAGIIISHRTSGPLHAFDLFVNDLINGNDRKFSLRDGDSYQDLEKMAEKLRAHLTSRRD